MKSNELGVAEVMKALNELRQQVSQLTQRVAALEQAAVDPPSAAGKPAEGLSEETILAISAAIAAFMGKRPHIRQIRLLGSATWAQQGRATIQASHVLNVRHG